MMFAVFGIGQTELIILAVLSMGCMGTIGVVALAVILVSQGNRKKD